MASLSEFQQKTLWEAWLPAEIRASYFALLSVSYQRRQKPFTAGSLVLSSGATLSFLITVIPAKYEWVRPVLTLAAAILSAVALLTKNERSAIGCQDLHSRWNGLAMEYEDLWSNVHADDAAEALRLLRKKEADISRSSTSMPSRSRLLNRAQDSVMLHHQNHVAA
jgi:hypothetical protein